MANSVRLFQRLAAAVFSLCLGVVAAAGCGEDPYDTTCNVDDDCVVVPTSLDCSGCGDCGRTTINRGDQVRYDEDLQETDCDDRPPPSTCGTVCDEPRAACADGTCALR
jgi:hypothetical protein